MHFLDLTSRDWMLVIVVTCQATIFAYIRHPIWKAFLLSLPIPFTLAMLAVGHRLDVTNIAGFGLLLVFYPLVRMAYRMWRWPIVAAIFLALCVYVGLAYSLSACLPRNATAFWCVAAIVFVAAWAQYASLPRVIEEDYRSPLPVWLKVPAIALVTVCVVFAKSYMQGFITSFPMVGLIAAYEGRFVLGTICRQIPLLVLTMFPMMLMIEITQGRLGYSWALVPAWTVFLLIMAPLTLWQRRTYIPKEA